MRRHTKEMTHAKRYNFIIKPEIHIKKNVKEKMSHSFYEMIGERIRSWGNFYENEKFHFLKS
jgi:hypothetical protein